MAMTWFKAHTEARVDPKLRCLTRDEHYVWFQLLCYAAEQPERGTIESFDDQVLAYAVADGDVELLKSTLETLVRLRIVSCVSTDDEGVSRVSSSVSSRVIAFVNFSKRQYARVSSGTNAAPKTSTDRVRKHRNSKKLRVDQAEQPKPQNDETQEDTRGNALKQGHETTDTDSDSEFPPHVSPPSLEHQSFNPEGQSATCIAPTKPSRTPEDLAEVREAERKLAADPRTESLAWTLGREHNLPDAIKIPGWKWIRAAEKILEPGTRESARRSFKYFATIAANLDDADRTPVKRGDAPPTREALYSPPPGGYYQGRKRTPEERAKLYSSQQEASLS